MSITILPCPHCGQQPIDRAIEPHTHALQIGDWKMPDHEGSHVIECECGAGMIDETRAAVAARWNQRTAPEAPEQTARKVLDAAVQWSCEREINDWDEADLAYALIDYEGDWPGCPGCDHDCDEPCMPATAAQQHAAIDHRIADLVHEGKLHPPDGYTPPDGWPPGPAPQSRQQRVRAAMQQADRDGPMPGMIAAFEARYSCDWTDPVWRDETATWAGAWGACLATQQAAQPADVVRLVEALDWIDDFIARCNGDDRGACEAVNRVRAALAAKGGA